MMTSWLADFRWAMNAMRARKFRRSTGFAERVRFDAALRPVRIHSHDMAEVIAYPDAFYRISVDDVIRAMKAATNVPHQGST